SRMEAAGQPPAMAAWLAMSLRPTEGGFVFGSNLQAMESLLADALSRDDWAVVSHPPPGLRFDFILGGRSTTVQPEVVHRLEALAAEGRLGLRVLSQAGHWLQVDDPEGTLRAATEALQ